MTDDEKRQQKAMLLLETQEAEQSLAELQEKAYRIAENIREIGQWLQEARGVMNMRMSDASDRHARVISGQQYRTAMNFDAAAALVAELTAARQKVQLLHERKAALGLK
jgi:hypothetical protein